MSEKKMSEKKMSMSKEIDLDLDHNFFQELSPNECATIAGGSRAGKLAKKVWNSLPSTKEVAAVVVPDVATTAANDAYEGVKGWLGF